MPAFFPHPLHRQMPLTPPEYYDHCSYGATNKVQPYGPHAAYDRYSQNSAFFATSQYYQPSQAEQRARYEAEVERQIRASYQAQVQREHVFGPIAQPILPPIREQPVNGMQGFHRPAAQPAPVAAPKQEKHAGGVAQELDYEMDVMVDFIAEMSTGMWSPFVSRHYLADVDLVRNVQPQLQHVEQKFRSYVSSVLTSTRLPSATLLLAMHYFSDRIKLRSARGDFPHAKTNNLYHHLTVALMLASKFLDDNTFQNRSWAEVSVLDVLELNAREMDWLTDIHWCLHVDWEDSDGVRAWFTRWDQYKAQKLSRNTDLSLDALKLTPIDTQLRNQYGGGYMPPTPFTPGSYKNLSARSATNLSAYDLNSVQPEPVRDPHIDHQSLQWPNIRSLSPPSAGPTSINTPEYYNSARTTPCYAPLQQYQQPPQFSGQQRLAPLADGEPHGQLLYTRQSPVYGPGYVMETRQTGSFTYDIHSFVGYDYTKQYAQELQIGWCDLHRRYDCTSCMSKHPMHHSAQAVTA